MIEPQFEVRVPESYYAPVDGQGRWTDILYDGGIAGVLFTNDASGLMVIRTDWREESQETLNEVEDLRVKSMGENLRPADVFDDYAKENFYSGFLNTDLLKYVRSIMVYDTQNTKYFRAPKSGDLIKITDTQPFIRKDKKWVEVIDETDIMEQELEEIDYSTILYYENMLQ